MVGIVQEQHPARTRLFMQWQGMDWPVLVDSLNLLEVAVVPITLAIDEHGIIRHLNPRPATLEAEFLGRTYPAPEGAPAPPPARPGPPTAPPAADTAAAWRSQAEALVLWGGPARLDEAITAFERALTRDPDHGPTHFRLGVAYRKRSETGHRRPTDFRRAVTHWERALTLDPNNYIWRRRLQQYGPRLTKPYPFYDWVTSAREEIAARGAAPVPLPVEPGGAEIAAPARAFPAAPPAPEADPRARVHRDRQGLITVEPVVVPSTVAPGGAVRVHLTFRPQPARRGHWNNEGGPLTVRVDPPAGWRADRRVVTVPGPPRAVSREPRTVELELRCPEDAPAGPVIVPGYALYYVCQGADGACLYRRQEVPIPVTVRPTP